MFNSDLAATYASLILADEGLEITVRIRTNMSIGRGEER